MKCDNCGETIAFEGKVCGHCGADKTKAQGSMIWGILGAVSGAVVGVVVGITFGPNALVGGLAGAFIGALVGRGFS